MTFQSFLDHLAKGTVDTIDSTILIFHSNLVFYQINIVNHAYKNLIPDIFSGGGYNGSSENGHNRTHHQALQRTERREGQFLLVWGLFPVFFL